MTNIFNKSEIISFKLNVYNTTKTVKRPGITSSSKELKINYLAIQC